MYDIIIIGAGLSGLAAGIRLSYYNKKVLILEKHFVAGGLNSYYERNGRVIDVGLHAMTNFTQKKDRSLPLMKLTRQLKIDINEFELLPHNFSQIKFPDNTLSFSNDYEFFLAEIKREFPQELDNFIKLVKFIENYDTYSITHKPFNSSRKIISSYIKNNVLINMILCPTLFYGSAWKYDMDFTQFAIIFKSIFLEGFSRPKNGMKKIIELLIDKFQKNGGELQLSSKVENIEKHDFFKVSTSKSTYKSKYVISSCGLIETQELTKRNLTNQELIKGEMTFVENIIVLKNHSFKKPTDGPGIIFFNNSNNFSYKPSKDITDPDSGVVCLPDNFGSDQRHYPQVKITSISNFNHWQNNYQKNKIEALHKVIEILPKLIPFTKNNIDFTDTFTPVTINEYTGHINGTVYGSPSKIPSGKTNIHNLFICGTDQGFLGITGSLLSGISIANSYCML